jgi:outer membrane protein OmpA-like peptidoglycan-associated protein
VCQSWDDLSFPSLKTNLTKRENMKTKMQVIRIVQNMKLNCDSILKRTIRAVLFSTVIITGFKAQAPTPSVAPGLPKVEVVPEYSRPSWWFGAVGAANFNFYNGSTQKLNNDLMVPVAFHSGNGIGLFVGPLVEFHKPDSRWGMMLQAGYDDRKGKFNQVTTPCNCPADLSTKVSYVTVEPSVRFAPFKGDLFLYGGPRVAYNLSKSFSYHLGNNPENTELAESPAATGELSDMKSVLISMQVGVGYDIHFSPKARQTQLVLAPFVAFHPYFGQSPRSIETWNVSTLRAGVAFKFGRGHKTSAEDTLPSQATNENVPVNVFVDPDNGMVITAPLNAPVARKMKEVFPIRNYVFFDLGSSEIPKRYNLLKKDEVKEFKEEQAVGFTSRTNTGRTLRQMTVYYNILNILGERMVKNPSTTIKLVGASEQGTADAEAMAMSIKNYLMSTFDIAGDRIALLGQSKPLIPSQHEGGTKELVLLKEGDRRVSIESTSPILLMEYQSGPGAPLRPVEINQEAPIESYVSIDVSNGKSEIVSWKLEFKDKSGKIQNFGPFTEKLATIPGKAILGTKAQGDYVVTMIGTTKKGDLVKQVSSVHVVLWKAPQTDELMRFSVIFEYDESNATTVYEKYLSEVVAPKIPKGGTVVIRGYTDIIGDAAHNKSLSVARATDVKNIIQASLAKTGRTDVKFDVSGSGENESLAPFTNKYPEERFYNRTVVIDILPAK